MSPLRYKYLFICASVLNQKKADFFKLGLRDFELCTKLLY